MHLYRVAIRWRTAQFRRVDPRIVCPTESAFTDEAREIVADWQRDGCYVSFVESRIASAQHSSLTIA
jgi:hypothetical protein